jgi:hypothetical protein
MGAVKVALKEVTEDQLLSEQLAGFNSVHQV